MRALAALVERVRNSLGALDPDGPREEQLRGFMAVSETDAARLEVFASQVDNGSILASTAAAVPAIREILGIVEYAKSVNPGAGWVMPPARITRWQRAREDSDRSLHEIQDECTRLLRVDA